MDVGNLLQYSIPVQLRTTLFACRSSYLSLIFVFMLPTVSADINNGQSKQPTALLEQTINQESSENQLCSPVSDSPLLPKVCKKPTMPFSHLAETISSGLFASSSLTPWLLIGGTGAGIAAISSSNNSGSDGGLTETSNNTTTDTHHATESINPDDYVTSEYKNRADLEAINASQAYANIAKKIASEKTVNAQHSHQQTGATHGGKGITIAILDTGVDSSHPSLKDNMSKTCSTLSGSGDCKKNLADTDINGHGTHVAGIAAGGKTGQPNSIHGVAYNATILAGCANLGGGCVTHNATEGELLSWAANHGATVANMSYGYTHGYRTKVVTDVTKGVKDYSFSGLKKYLFGNHSLLPDSNYQQAKSAFQKGLIVTVAAGNTLITNTPENNEPSLVSLAPLIYENTDLKKDLDYQWITVVNTDNQGNISSTSHACGDAAKFCIAAPGTDIQSTLPNGRYGKRSGTSMATPQVSGAVALLAGAFPSLTLPDNHTSASVCNTNSADYSSKQCHSKAVVNRIFVTATDIGAKGIDPIYGNGMLNLAAATDFIGTAQLYSPSGSSYSLFDTNLSASQAISPKLSRQLTTVNFLAMDSYDKAGFLFNGQTLLGFNSTAEARIDTLHYLNRSKKTSPLSTTALSPQMRFNMRKVTGADQKANGQFQLTYQFTANTQFNAGYNFNQFQNTTKKNHLHSGYESLFISQAFQSPLGHFNQDAQSLGFNHTLSSNHFFTASIHQGEVSENFTQHEEALKTTSVAATLGGQLTRHLSGRIVAGALTENQSLLGSSGSGLWETTKSRSRMMGINLNYQLAKNIHTLLNYYTLSTQAGQTHELINYDGRLKSHSLSAGLIATENDNWQYGFFATQPVRLSSGKAMLTLPVSYKGKALNYRNIELDLTPEGRQMEYEFAINWTPENLPVYSKFNLIKIEDFNHIKGNNDIISLITLGVEY